MTQRKRNVIATSAKGSGSIEDYPKNASRPSKTNCTTGVSGPVTPESGDGLDDDGESGYCEEDLSPGDWWHRKNEIVDRFIEKWPQRAARPVSVRGGTKIRDEAAAEKIGREERYRSRTWSAVLNEFLQWYNDYRGAELVYLSPDSEEVRAPMENSHMPQYGDRYYARIKAFERQIIKEFDEPYSALLTFSGSSRNANGGWRCPADHLRDVVESWRPKRGRGVYHTLRDVLSGKRWEYALVVEKHKSGYGHVHCAVVVDGAVSEEDFFPVIDAHLRCCEIAGREAHDYLSPDPDDRPISVNRIDPSDESDEAIGNLGSYLAEYIGAYGKELFERSLDELVFRAAAWATGTQIVRFSTGANEMIERDRGDAREDPPEERVIPNPEFDPELHSTPESDVPPFLIENPSWSIVGIARTEGEEERLFELRQSHVVWREIDDASHLDPPKQLPRGDPR